MDATQASAVASPSPWGGPSTTVHIATTEQTVTLSTDCQRLVLQTATLSGTAGLGVLRLAGPDLPDEVELDFRTRRGVTIGADAWARRYAELADTGFRDTVAALETGGAKLSLHGVARAQRGGQNGMALGTAWLLAFCEIGLVGFSADFFGRAIGGHLTSSSVLAMILAALFAIFAFAGVFALPWHAMVDASRAAARTPTAHFDDMIFSHAPNQALFSAMLPFVPDPPAGRDQVYVVLPWRPRWRLPAIGLLFMIAAIGSATNPDTAGGILGMIGRIALLVVILLAYYLRDSRVIAVDLHAAGRLRNARRTCYLAAIGAGIGLGVLYRVIDF